MRGTDVKDNPGRRPGGRLPVSDGGVVAHLNDLSFPSQGLTPWPIDQATVQKHGMSGERFRLIQLITTDSI